MLYSLAVECFSQKFQPTVSGDDGVFIGVIFHRRLGGRHASVEHGQTTAQRTQVRSLTRHSLVDHTRRTHSHVTHSHVTHTSHSHTHSHVRYSHVALTHSLTRHTHVTHTHTSHSHTHSHVALTRHSHVTHTHVTLTHSLTRRSCFYTLYCCTVCEICIVHQQIGCEDASLKSRIISLIGHKTFTQLDTIHWCSISTDEKHLLTYLLAQPQPRHLHFIYIYGKNLPVYNQV